MGDHSRRLRGTAQIANGVKRVSERERNAPSRAQIIAACLAACARCASAAETCATLCLKEHSGQDLARLIALGRTCADVCLLTSRLLSQQSEFVQEYCALCAEVCHILREECLKHIKLTCCRRCAEIAHSCDVACQKAAV